MAFNIDPETKAAFLNDRIRQFNIEGYQHEINKKTAEALGNQEGIDAADAAIAQIETAIAVHEAELNEPTQSL
jgi:hypothetical protein